MIHAPRRLRNLRIPKRLKQFKQWMPNHFLRLVDATSATESAPATARFRVSPKMTKHEIREYLVQIYNLPVTRVNTMNYAGKHKRLISRRGLAYFKYSDFKAAVVTFGEGLKDVGIGTRIPELEDDSTSGGS